MSPLITEAWRWLERTARLAIGVPDYAAYVEHVRSHHPEHAPMSREEFFVERMQARYGKGRSRCC
ncbi:MAG: YbdD/YjiX family protein [Xanthomonadales bacterium]|nr:YbdD/YjiX family protein [Xanthomonadales bacterium]